MDLFLFAQGGGTAADYGIAAIVATPLLGALIWFMRHVMTVTIPDMNKATAKALEDKDILHAAALKDARDAFERALVLITQHCKEEMENLVETALKLRGIQ